MSTALRLPLIPIFSAYTIGIYVGHLELPFRFRGLFPFVPIPYADRTWMGFALDVLGILGLVALGIVALKA